MRHYVHALCPVPGTVRVPGKDAVVAGVVPLTAGEGELNHARRGGQVHAHLGKGADSDRHATGTTCLDVLKSYLLFRNHNVVYRLLLKGLDLLNYVHISPNINDFMQHSLI